MDMEQPGCLEQILRLLTGSMMMVAVVMALLMMVI